MTTRYIHSRALQRRTETVSKHLETVDGQLKRLEARIATLAEMHNILVGTGCGPGLAYSIAGKE